MVLRKLAAADVCLGWLTGWKRWSCGDLGDNQVFIIMFTTPEMTGEDYVVPVIMCICVCIFCLHYRCKQSTVCSNDEWFKLPIVSQLSPVNCLDWYQGAQCGGTCAFRLTFYPSSVDTTLSDSTDWAHTAVCTPWLILVNAPVWM